MIDGFLDVRADVSSRTFFPVEVIACKKKLPDALELPVTASAVHGVTGAVAGEVQKDAVVLRLRVQRLLDVVHGVFQAGRRAGSGAQSPAQHVHVLTRGGLWEDTGGRML